MKRRHTTISREGLYYLFVLAFVVTGALLRDINLLVIVAGLMVGPLVYNWRAVVASLQGLKVERRLPDGICAGDLLVVDITLTNTRKRRDSWAVAVQDSVERETVDGGGERVRASVLFDRVGPGETHHRTYEGRFDTRGRYRFESLAASTRFPLGFVRHALSIAAAATLIVYPRLGRLAPGWRRLHRDDALGTQRIRRQQGASDGDFFALRDWRTDDSRRWIHWRTSARRGKLVVRQFEQQRNEDMVLVVDLYSPKSATRSDDDLVEKTVRFVATAVSDLCRRGGSNLHLGIAGKTTRSLNGAASIVLLAEAMEHLAVVQGGPAQGIGEVIEAAAGRVSASTRMIVISTRGLDAGHKAWPLDLPDAITQRLAAGRIVPIDVRSDRLGEYYHDGDERLTDSLLAAVTSGENGGNGTSHSPLAPGGNLGLTTF